MRLSKQWLLVVSFGFLTVPSLGCGFLDESALVALSGRLLAKAQPDECFIDVGVRAPIGEGGVCAEGLAKVNEAYVWGLWQKYHRLWFGSGPNVHCLVIGGLLSAVGDVTPIVNDDYACEYGEGPYVPPLPDAIGDFRPPHMYYYDQLFQKLVDVTPDDPLVETTLGVRGAAATDWVVFMGGPAAGGSGVNLFAFSAITGQYLGSRHFDEYDNFRKGLVHDGVLYLGFGKNGGGGAVVRHVKAWPWHPDYPFNFEVVGDDFDGEAVELAVHQGALFAGTWPTFGAGGGGGGEGGPGLDDLPPPAGLWKSPPLPPGGLTAADAGSWEKVWSYAEYDPDLVAAISTGMGAMASYGDYLWWGSMHVPLIHTVGHILVSNALGYEIDLLETFFNSFRAISIFRGKDFGTPDQQVQVVYGQPTLPALNLLPVFFGQPPVWENQPNGIGPPLYGGSGFGGKLFLNYTWTMQVWKGQLFVGTMDWSYLLSGLLGSLPDVPDLPIPLPEADFGADLWRFPDPDSPAEFESINGVGNHTSYGIRTMIADAHHLYLGMANPMNLRTDPDAPIGQGGWELIELFETPDLPAPPPEP